MKRWISRLLTYASSFSLTLLMSCDRFDAATSTVDQERIMPPKISSEERALAYEFERPPMLATLKQGNKTLTLIGLHAKPKRAALEASLLADVQKLAKTLGFPANTVIMGDLNLDCSYASQKAIANLPILKTFRLLIPNDADTTTGTSSCAYDRALSNIPAEASVLTASPVQSFSDHHAIAASIKGFGTLCAWNAQRLSSKKVAAKPGIIAATESLIAECDAVLLQEVLDEQAILALMQKPRLQVKMSDKLGTSSYKECYVLLSRSLQITKFHILGQEESDNHCTKPAANSQVAP